MARGPCARRPPSAAVPLSVGADGSRCRLSGLVAPAAPAPATTTGRTARPRSERPAAHRMEMFAEFAHRRTLSWGCRRKTSNSSAEKPSKKHSEGSRTPRRPPTADLLRVEDDNSTRQQRCGSTGSDSNILTVTEARRRPSVKEGSGEGRKRKSSSARSGDSRRGSSANSSCCGDTSFKIDSLMLWTGRMFQTPNLLVDVEVSQVLWLDTGSGCSVDLMFSVLYFDREITY